MRYVFLILALLIGIPSVTHANQVCEDECSSYSSDVSCDVATGHCIEPYQQCVSRCESGTGDAPAGVQCIAERVTGWDHPTEYGIQKVSLWRCGWGHFLIFGKPPRPVMTPFLQEQQLNSCTSTCNQYTWDRTCDVQGTCQDSHAECVSACINPQGLLLDTPPSTECAPEKVWGWTVCDLPSQEFQSGVCQHRALWRCGSMHWVWFGDWMSRSWYRP
jgi:hypothetical protein